MSYSSPKSFALLVNIMIVASTHVEVQHTSTWLCCV